MELEEYKKKRDFTRTPEPEGGIRKRAPMVFVTQRHHARREHYDFRLEIGGVLKSWAIPKGPSLDPNIKRLAVHTEDHPIEYAAFEGVIPKHSYGAGPVLIWDRGLWEPEEDPLMGYRNGKLKFTLYGEKLKGGWVLFRLQKDDQQWILRKLEDDAASNELDILEAMPLSAVSGRSIADLEERANPSQVKSTLRLPKAPPIQLPTLAAEPPTGPEWVHEIKYDGYRLLALLENGSVSFLTRNYQDWSSKLPVLESELQALPGPTILDGEIAVMRVDGTTDFQRLRTAIFETGTTSIQFFVFDLLYWKGEDFRKRELIERKEMLRQILLGAKMEHVHYVEHLRARGDAVYRHACKLGLEGIVSKRRDSPYEGNRSDNWRKIKCTKIRHLTVGGYTAPSGSRVGFGALLLGYKEDGGKLIYCGKVGVGFSQDDLIWLKDLLIARRSSPFENPPSDRGVNWVEPSLVVKIEFQEWTKDGLLRHARFLGVSEGEPIRMSGAKVKADKIHTEGVKITHAHRPVYSGISKIELARYYEIIAPYMLPLLKERPLSLLRCPGGEAGQCFFSKHLKGDLPKGVGSVLIGERDAEERYIYVENTSGIISLVQLGALEFHTWGSMRDQIEKPDMMIFDLDPGPGVKWEQVIIATRLLRNRLTELGLASFVKTSGGKGLHVLVPLIRRSSWDEVKLFARAVTEDLCHIAPDRFVTTMKKSVRRGRIFIDFFRNNRGSTCITAYSTRARPGAPVSMPLDWEQLSVDLGPAAFTVVNIEKWVADRPADPWAGFTAARKALTKRMWHAVESSQPR